MGWFLEQVLNQDLVMGCPKLAIVKYLGVLFFKGDLITNENENMYLIIEIRQIILIQCHIEVEKNQLYA